MATKVLMNRMTTTTCTPLAEKSLNKPPHLTNNSRKRSATFLAMGSSCMEEPMLSNHHHLHKKRRTAPKPAMKKSVRFNLQKNTSISPAASSSSSSSSSLLPAALFLDDDTINTLWFSAEELHQIRLREGNVVKIHRFCEYYLHQMTCLLGLACGAKTPSDDGSDTTAQLFVSNSPARGLEKELLACVRHRRKEVIQTFLKSQAALQNHPNKKFSTQPTFREKVLSQHYIKLARPSVRLAQLIAHGDSMVVGTTFSACSTTTATTEEQVNN